MSIVDRIGIGGVAALIFTVLGVAVSLSISDYRASQRREAFMSQCIEMWSVDQCATWDRYGRRDLAFRKDR